MSAAPFGGHPTLAEYAEWARQQGCIIEQGLNIKGGRAISVTKIVAPSGKWVIEVGTQHDDYLVPTTVNRLDRRLGLRSPFPSMPHPGPL
jgi:hypothetical protein